MMVQQIQVAFLSDIIPLFEKKKVVQEEVFTGTWDTK